MELAVARPDLVTWLVLLDPPFDPKLRNTEVGDVAGLRHAAPGELEAYLLERNPGGGELLASTLAREFRQADDHAFEALLAAGPFHARRLDIPTLLIQADPARGGVLGDRGAAAAVSALGDASLLKLNGAPHAVHASHAAQVADAIKAFAAAHPVSRSTLPDPRPTGVAPDQSGGYRDSRSGCRH
jgi:pimeloyl-ACP methyl ester carboxylesterase